MALLPSAVGLAVWIPFVRYTKQARPIADALVVSSSALLLPMIVFFVNTIRDPVLFFAASENYSIRLYRDGTDAEGMMIVTSYLCLAGLVQGVVYWVSAGRPNAPYATDLE